MAQQTKASRPDAESQEDHITLDDTSDEIESDSEEMAELLERVRVGQEGVEWSKEDQEKGKAFLIDKLISVLDRLSEIVEGMDLSSVRSRDDVLSRPSFQKGVEALNMMVAKGTADVKIFAAESIGEECSCIGEGEEKGLSSRV
jgi:hypothetical protein